MKPTRRLDSIPGRRMQMLFAFALVGATAIVGCSGPGQNTTPPASLSDHHRSAQSVVPTPPSGAYLGAYVNPPGSPNPSQTFLEGQTEQLEKTAPADPTLTLHLQYRSWSQLASPSPSSSPDIGLQGDIDHNRVPVISWSCSDDITQDSQHQNLNLLEIAAGMGDNDIVKIANNLAALTSHRGLNYPVDIRYFWEFNINATNTPSFANALYPQNSGCFLAPGTPVNLPGVSQAPPLNVQFINAWTHIWKVFARTYANMNPRPNISFVWNPNVIGSTDVGNVYIDASTFYPGNAYVDWIAADGYNKISKSTGNPVGFDAVFSGFYAEYTNTTPYNTEPLMIGETGSCANFPPPYDQATFFSTITNELPTQYPAIRALDYFDEKAQYYYQTPGCSWALDANGITAFGTLAHTPYFVQSIPGVQ